MKLKMSVPERPGWIFVLPGFDFVVLLLALVMLAGAVEQESYVAINLPSSEYRGVPLGEERPVIIMLKSTSKGPTYYMNGVKIEEEDLSAAISEAVEKRGTRRVAIEVDQDASMTERNVLINILTNLELGILDVYRRNEGTKEGN